MAGGAWRGVSAAGSKRVVIGSYRGALYLRMRRAGRAGVRAPRPAAETPDRRVEGSFDRSAELSGARMSSGLGA